MSNPKKSTDTGMNRTGAAVRPVEAKRTMAGAREGAQEAGITPRFESLGIERVREDYSRSAEPVGTMPPPGNLKGLAKAGVEALKGHNPNVFLDLIGDRLAFERTGVRLYEAALVKLAASDDDHLPVRGELERIRDEELEHVAILIAAMEMAGGDPTAITPTADICGVASEGILKVTTDPRATFTHALHALVSAELTDNDAWMTLADLADGLGHAEMATEFRRALADEERHLEQVRTWLTDAIEGQAGLTTTDEIATPPPPP